ncbi:MAG: Holliday junction branch migration protein RuvA [Ruminococcaceae bacterium]|nr:Holliday junction branch migration protein RuvA [Oscillospiraceae bacterium]
MYYYLNGTLAELSVNMAVIDCGGVGYLLTISGTTYDTLVKKGGMTASGEASGTKVKLYTYQAVREDAIELFGFYSMNECNLFKLLITVSGVGPKAAMAILSALSVESFVSACAANDAKAISRANGVGLKTAQKIILELKDKVAKGFDMSGDVLDSVSPAGNAYVPSSVTGEAIDALCVLGYTTAEATKAVKACSGATVEDIIRQALALLMK